MSELTEQAASSTSQRDAATAPFVYFDLAPTYGVLGGAVQIELASRIMIQNPDGGVDVKFITTTHLRCSQAAAEHLRDAINAALKLLEQPQKEQISAARKLN